ENRYVIGLGMGVVSLMFGRLGCHRLIVRLPLARFVPASGSNQVNKSENQDPHEIDKVPVQTRNLDQVRIGNGEHALERSREQRSEIEHAAGDVHPMKSGQDEKGCAEKAGLDGEMLAPNQVMPFVGLASKKRDAAENRQREVALHLGHVAVLYPRQ